MEFGEIGGNVDDDLPYEHLLQAKAIPDLFADTIAFLTLGNTFDDYIYA